MSEDMWRVYDLDMQVEHLVGGIPKDPEMIKRWHEAKWPTVVPSGAPATPEKATEMTVEDIAETAKGMWTGFYSPEGVGLAIPARHVKAMLKESANIVKDLPQLVGKTGKPQPLRARLAERVFVEPHWIPLGRSEPDGSEERAIHVMTPRGPRTALKRCDHVDDVKLQCQLRVLDDGIFTEATLRVILDHAQFNGIGSDRSLGHGTFSYTLTRVE